MGIPEQLPHNTIKLLQKVSVGHYSITDFAQSSDDEVFARIQYLLEKGYIEQLSETAEEIEYPGSFRITQSGKALLTDIAVIRAERLKERWINAAISAVTAAVIAWGPKLLQQLLLLIQQP